MGVTREAVAVSKAPAGVNTLILWRNSGQAGSPRNKLLAVWQWRDLPALALI
jgi:hypothetical protein